ADDLAAADALVDISPQVSSYALRANMHADRRDWDRAAEDFAKVFELGEKTHPSILSQTWHNLALVRLANGDQPGFQAACAEMLKQFGQTEDETTANTVAWSCALGPDALIDFAPAIAMVENFARQNGKTKQHAAPLGAILYRAGR